MKSRGVLLAFEYGATGLHSRKDIADLLNTAGYWTKTGRLFSKDNVREMLRNKVYVGMVSYQETRYNANGGRNFSAPVSWGKGRHAPIVGTEL